MGRMDEGTAGGVDICPCEVRECCTPTDKESKKGDGGANTLIHRHDNRDMNSYRVVNVGLVCTVLNAE